MTLIVVLIIYFVGVKIRMQFRFQNLPELAELYGFSCRLDIDSFPLNYNGSAN